MILRKISEDVCPFNCSNALSHAGRLQCQNGTWQAGAQKYFMFSGYYDRLYR